MKIPSFDARRPSQSARRFLAGRYHEGQPCQVVGPKTEGHTDDGDPRFALLVDTVAVWSGYCDVARGELVTRWGIMPDARTRATRGDGKTARKPGPRPKSAEDKRRVRQVYLSDSEWAEVVRRLEPMSGGGTSDGQVVAEALRALSRGEWAPKRPPPLTEAERWRLRGAHSPSDFQKLEAAVRGARDGLLPPDWEVTHRDPYGIEMSR